MHSFVKQLGWDCTTFFFLTEAKHLLTFCTDWDKMFIQLYYGPSPGRQLILQDRQSGVLNRSDLILIKSLLHFIHGNVLNVNFD